MIMLISFDVRLKISTHSFRGRMRQRSFPLLPASILYHFTGRSREGRTINIFFNYFDNAEMEENKEAESANATTRSKPNIMNSNNQKSPKVEDNSFNWKKFLAANPNHGMEAVPVWAFDNAPLSDIWDQLEVKELRAEYLVEENLTSDAYTSVYWLGTVKNYFGYFAKLKDDGYPESKPDVPYQWLNFLTELFRIGHCSSMGKSSALVPPTQIIKEQKDWRDYVLVLLVDHLTIHPIVEERMKEANILRLNQGSAVEVIDCNNFSQMKPGIVMEGKGTRVYVLYSDALGPTSTFGSGIWCDIKSDWLVPRGWCKTIGHPINAEEAYDPKIIPEDYLKDDPGIETEIGMKLEAVHTSKPGFITSATVVAVLKNGFIMVSFDGDFSNNDNEPDPAEMTGGPKAFCFHLTSPNIFYAGFCKDFDIDLVPPAGFTNSIAQAFRWEKYFEETGSKALPIKDAREYEIQHSFMTGRKLEAVDLTEPSTIRTAAVSSVKGRLLKIRFEGLPDEHDQWMDAESPDLYPVGWCDTFKHKLTGPRRDSIFWSKFKHPSLFKSKSISRSKGNFHLAAPEATKNGQGVKRKVVDAFENAVFNSEVMKEDAVKLGTKSKLVRKSNIEELRSAANKKKSR